MLHGHRDYAGEFDEAHHQPGASPADEAPRLASTTTRARMRGQTASSSSTCRAWMRTRCAQPSGTTPFSQVPESPWPRERQLEFDAAPQPRRDGPDARR